MSIITTRAKRVTKKTRNHRNKGLLDEKSIMFYDMTSLFSQQSNVCQSKQSGNDDNINPDAGISLVIDDNGLIYATFPNGIVILSDSDRDGASGSLLGTLFLNEDNIQTQHSRGRKVGEDDVCDSYEVNSRRISPSSIDIGKDQYLYLTTDKDLIRMKLKSTSLNHPTNLIVPSRKGVLK